MINSQKSIEADVYRTSVKKKMGKLINTLPVEYINFAGGVKIIGKWQFKNISSLHWEGNIKIASLDIEGSDFLLLKEKDV
jgi:hypothetical protein